jgi:hypothetical protein
MFYFKNIYICIPSLVFSGIIVTGRASDAGEVEGEKPD